MNIHAENYELNVVSQLGDFKGKTFKKYAIDGENYIGVFGNEPFEIVFHNKTREPVQVKVTLDGTDILTGKPGDTSPNGEMWMVRAYGTLNLKGFPENHSGGAQFVFTDAEKSVAAHTHGNTSSKGIIAVAVFREAYKPAPSPYYDDYKSVTRSFNTKGIGGGLLSAAPAADGRNTKGVSVDYSASVNLNESFDMERSLDKSSAAVGAGSFVSQKITHVKSFVEPILSSVVSVRFAWYDELKAKIKEREKVTAQNGNVMPGFPGDKPIMSIGSTPRIDTVNRFNSGENTTVATTTVAAPPARFY